MPKKLAHHVVATKVARLPVAEHINGCLQLDRDDPDLMCEGKCGTEHKKPVVHWIRTGYCSFHMDQQTHQHCPGILRSNMGGKKPVVCECDCHQGGETDWGTDTHPDIEKLKKTGPKKKVTASA